MKTILAIRMRQLGDVLATLGTLREIKRVYPGATILYMVDRHYHRLLEPVDYVDSLLPPPPKIGDRSGAIDYERYVRRLRRVHVDAVLDFHSNLRSAVLSYLTGAPVRAGFDVRVRKALYTHVEPRVRFDGDRRLPQTTHESALSLARCAGLEVGGGSTRDTLTHTPVDVENGRQLLRTCGIPSAEVSGLVGINAGNPYPAKDWHDENFDVLIQRLRRQGRSAVVIWGPGERQRAERIVARGGETVYLAPKTALHELPGLLRNLAVLVTIDSGLKHLAVAVGVPTVTLFGPTNPHEWHMGGERDRYLWANLSCSPCRLERCPFGSPCMGRLTPAAVLREIAILESASRAA